MYWALINSLMISDIHSHQNDYRLLRRKNLPRSLHVAWVLKVPQKTLPCIPNTDVIKKIYLQDVIFQKMSHEKHPQRTVLVKTPCNVHKLLISFFYFIYQDKLDNVFHKEQHRFLHEFMYESSHGITWSPEHLMFQGPRQPRIKISIGFILLPWRRITTLSFLFEEHSLERDHLNKELINKHLSISPASSFTLCTLLFYEDTRRLQSNRVERNVEFFFLLNMKRLVILKQQQKKMLITKGK